MGSWGGLGSPCQGVVLACVGLKSMGPAHGKEAECGVEESHGALGPKG